MPSKVGRLVKKKLITPPKWLAGSIQYETIMGSVAYGVSNDTSDCDVYGFCIPPVTDMFPHLRGEVPGFGRQKHRFAQYQEHHVEDREARKVYDFSIYSIVKYFDLAMGCNPNMIDSLFTPRRCVLYSTQVGEMVRDGRRLFLHKGAWHKFKGYAYSQMHKIDVRRNAANPARAASIEEHGYDVKFGYHVVRLLDEVEQIMSEGDLDLTRNREQLKAIRRGEWPLDYLKAWFEESEKGLERLYQESKLPHGPDEQAIKSLLMNCIEQHHGSLNLAVEAGLDERALVEDLRKLVEKHKIF